MYNSTRAVQRIYFLSTIKPQLVSNRETCDYYWAFLGSFGQKKAKTDLKSPVIITGHSIWYELWLDSRGISTYSTINDDTASTLNDIYLYLGKRTFSFDTAIDTELRASTSCALQFGTQKNLQKGDVIAQSCFLDPHYCPIKALVRLVLRHWQYFASKNISFDGSIPLAPF